MSTDATKNPAVGIDLGTTNTVVAVMRGEGEGPIVLDVPQPSRYRGELEPLPQIKSAVYFESPDSAVVGAYAFDRADSFRSVKSKMGTRWRVAHPHFATSLTAPYISAHVLKLAYQAIASEYPDWDRTAVITVPASFNTTQRHDTLRAAGLAGFCRDGVRLLDEPTAAFCYYFYINRHANEFERERYAMVFDFGGGTLDVSVIHVGLASSGHMVIDTIGRSRYNNLGGDDIDQDLAAYLLAAWAEGEPGRVLGLPAQVRSELYRRVVAGASRFKETVEDTILDGARWVGEYHLGYEIEGRPFSCEGRLAPEQYHEFTGRYFHPGGELNIFRPIEEAISLTKQIRPGFEEGWLDLLLHTGGASRMDGVRRALQAYAVQRRFSVHGFEPIDEEHPCDTVAQGAAYFQYQKLFGEGRIEVTNRFLESILTRDDDGRGFVEIVPLGCEPDESFRVSPTEFRTTQQVLRIKRSLFRGVGPYDHQITAIPDLVTRQLPDVVAEGSPYCVAFRLSGDKLIDLRVNLVLNGTPYEEVISVDPFASAGQPGEKLPPLCRVNPI
jgi:hypothetical protein